MKDTLYYLSYDLIKNKDYQTLYAELQKYGAKRVLESVWCFKYTNNNTEALRDHFMKFIDSDDKLLVIKSAHWAGCRLMSDPNKL
ncbi:hypothetical protein [Chryseobacterium sp. Marseille-Q3244]|uniref:hypothetical protein n=1 Tax=Chryseobacterium sp. Marseille-Q3244 TaxID=2758092 RepID=UPI002024A56A|nr:hypothetical protein [Chryseobacterium sp. Marseille-Q3244]